MSDIVSIKVHLAPGARLPARATAGSAGYDVHALLEPDTYIELGPGERMAVPTGLSFELPPGTFLSLRPRSGLALKHGITLLNAPATIDSDYRGELLVLMANLGQNLFRIQSGDRVCQMLVERSLEIHWEKAGVLGDLEGSERGVGGFGSTGRGLS